MKIINDALNYLSAESIPVGLLKKRFIFGAGGNTQRLQAQCYLSNHGLQERGVSHILQQFNSKINWKKVNKILDIGCGPGDISVNYLLSSAPKEAEMIGIDISPDMLQLANKAFSNPLLKFVLADIGDPKFGETYKECFDLVFSFYCIHFIPNQKLVFKNIYDVLKPGGETLFSIIVSCPFFDLDQIIAKREKWAPYMQHQKEVISPYNDVEKPEHIAKNLLFDAGFEVEDCFLSTVLDTMPSKEIFYKSVQAINPYLSEIPEHLHEEYFEECKREYFSNRKLLTISDKTSEVSYSYSHIIVFARKPVCISSKNI